MLHLPVFASAAIHAELADLHRLSGFVPFIVLPSLPFGKKSQIRSRLHIKAHRSALKSCQVLEVMKPLAIH